MVWQDIFKNNLKVTIKRSEVFVWMKSLLSAAVKMEVVLGGAGSGQDLVLNTLKHGQDMLARLKSSEPQYELADQAR